MIRCAVLILVLLSCLPAEEAARGVAAYWAFRGRDHGQEIEPEDLSSAALRAPGYAGAASVVHYRFQWDGNEGQPQHQRELLLLLDGERLLGWYNISGCNNDFATARFDGSVLGLPNGLRIGVWPPPPVLVEPASGPDEVEQRFLLHTATAAPPPLRP